MVTMAGDPSNFSKLASVQMIAPISGERIVLRPEHSVCQNQYKPQADGLLYRVIKLLISALVAIYTAGLRSCQGCGFWQGLARSIGKGLCQEFCWSGHGYSRYKESHRGQDKTK